MTEHDRTDAIARIVQQLRREYRPDKVILFGSYADGTPNGSSDVDLLIVKQTTDRFIDRWATVRRILSDSTRWFALDTLILSPDEIRERLARGDQFLQHILEHGRVMYEA